MSDKRVDYDGIAANYNRRYVVSRQDAIANALLTLARNLTAARILDHKVGREVLDDPFLRKDSTSQLVLLSDEAYAAGLRRIEAALTEAEAVGRALIFPDDISIAMLVGRVSEREKSACST